MLGAASTSDDEPPPSDKDEECPTNRDQPHLRFEITSDDGFSVEADSIEGKANIEKEIFKFCCSQNNKISFLIWSTFPFIVFTLHLLLNFPFSGLESSDRRGAGSTSNCKVETSDLSEDHRCSYAGSGS